MLLGTLSVLFSSRSRCLRNLWRFTVLAFISVILVPGLKYPANPPSVGDPDTIRQRTKLFFLMMVVSIAALVVAVSLFRKLLARNGGCTQRCRQSYSTW